MPKKTDPRVDAYIAQAAPFARPILIHLRQLIHQACPTAIETIKWSRPVFLYEGKMLCMVATFKAHLGFGFWHRQMEKIITAERGTVDDGSGMLGRITQLADLPDDATLRRYLTTAMDLTVSGQRARPAPKPKQPLAVPADLTAALKTSPAASATFKKFSPSCRREYIEWITEAKREETRAKRIATALEWLAEGKQRNWKYQNC